MYLQGLVIDMSVLVSGEEDEEGEEEKEEGKKKSSKTIKARSERMIQWREYKEDIRKRGAYEEQL